MNRGFASSDNARLIADSMPAPGDHYELGDAVSGLEGLHHGDDSGGLGLIALESTRLGEGTRGGRPAGRR
jgi:hypothetical protein